MQEYFTESQAAEFIGRKKNTLNLWRCGVGTGPKYTKDPKGMIMYKRQDLIDWIEGGSQESENRMEK